MFNTKAIARKRACLAVGKLFPGKCSLEMDRYEKPRYMSWWNIENGNKICVLSHNIFDPSCEIYLEEYTLVRT